jgi:putative mRNA 3-end processing factor
MPPLLRSDDTGLACESGGFWIDPWRPAPVAVVSHAHSDHARPGSGVYYAARPGVELLRRRIGSDADIRPLEYAEPIDFGPVRVSLHPAGHVLGSAQVRVEHAGEVWVFSGDYKRATDPTAAPFEVVPCSTFITEATFALPIYRWRPGAAVVREVLEWWRANASVGRASVLMCYALGKAQRLLAELALLQDAGEALPGPVKLHGATQTLVEVYRSLGVRMVETEAMGESTSRKRADLAGVLAVAPPSAGGSPWMRRFGAAERYETAFVSGWMQVRGIRRRRGYDRGFVLSDHADWPDLVRTIADTGARRVLCTHGNTGPLVRFLRERELDAAALQTAYAEEDEE